jgi:Family of unknown function (DUF6370)
MRNVFLSLLVICLACGLIATLPAADKEEKEVKLTGKIVCAKCELKETKECTTAIQVKENGKTVTYYFDDKGDEEKYHSKVCGGGEEEGTVTGVVVDKKDNKKWIKPTKVEYGKGSK